MKKNLTIDQIQSWLGQKDRDENHLIDFPQDTWHIIKITGNRAYSVEREQYYGPKLRGKLYHLSQFSIELNRKDRSEYGTDSYNHIFSGTIKELQIFLSTDSRYASEYRIALKRINMKAFM